MARRPPRPACKGRTNTDDDNLPPPSGRPAKSNRRRRRDAAIDPKHRKAILIFTFSMALIICVASLMVVLCAGAGYDATPNTATRPPPDIFIRLVGKGLDDPVSSPAAARPTSPVFQLAFDVDAGASPGCYQACGGGESSWLRVSFHGMVMAWGQMPYFCISDGGQSTDVAAMEARAEASVLWEEVRNLFWSGMQLFGRIEFDVEGEVEGLGHLRCKFFILEDESADVPKSLCASGGCIQWHAK